MTALLRSELLKLQTSKTTLGLTAGMLALVAFVVLLHGFAIPDDDVTRNDEMRVFGLAGLGAVFASLLGALSITEEIRNGTIRPTFLATPRRSRVLAAKLVAVAAVGVLFGAASAALAIGLGNVSLSARGIPVQLDGGDYARLVAGSVVAAALWAPLGLGLGALLRNPVATLVGLTAWMLFIETLVLGQLPKIGRYLPGSAAGAIGGATITGQIPTDPALLAPALGALLLLAYAAFATVAGIVATDRRDVP